MTEEHHASEHPAGSLGGILDLTAVGLGYGIVIAGLFSYKGHLTVTEWFAIAAVTAVVGAIVGNIWGTNRGY